MKDNQHISWDEYFMSLAVLVSLRSKDPSTKVGAVLVKDRRVIGTGYNGFPSGCDESQFSWERNVKDQGWINTKYPYVIHAEANALLNTVAPTSGSELFVTLHPCNECAKLLVQGGISKITYLDNKHAEQDPFVAAKKIMEVNGITLRQLPRDQIQFSAISKAFSDCANLP